MNTDIELLRAACDHDLGDPAFWFSPDGYPNSLALCAIDAIYSTGARYGMVGKVIGRYRSYRAEQGGDADTDGIPELLATIHELGGPDPWASQIGNRRPTSTAANAPLRSVAIFQVAEALAALEIHTTENLRAVADDDERRDRAEAAWCAAPGQRSGITWDYAQMLAQIPGGNADRVVVGYVARVIGPVDAGRAAELVRGVADAAGWSATALDHAIWRFESGRPHQRAA
ncbi:heme peroxidase [Mycolicibacterium sp. XJ870]